ncbi:uncharacterized protein LOC123886284 [Trifolium pratense]|uniref:uncharacterized protein LOC123886284 n=1 Tax=Trifolium pratense TaxID=57577 RepID=UPI001E694C89|nr:uncharacterized protein LOC123886284 [Trifolium pratense]
MDKAFSEAYQLIESMDQNHYQWGSERTPEEKPQTKGGTFHGQPQQNPKGQANAIILQSGKQVDGQTNPETDIPTMHQDFEKTIEKESEPNREEKEDSGEETLEKKRPYVPLPPYKPLIPYPQRFEKSKSEGQFKKFVELLKKLNITIPFTEAITQMPSYAKFLKEIVTNKKKMERDQTKYSEILKTSTPPTHENGDNNLAKCLEITQDPTPRPVKPTMELKTLPDNLRYEFLDKDLERPVIVSTDLEKSETEKLLNILRKYPIALGYNITDLKGISPYICMHRIMLEEDCKTSREPQRRINLVLSEVVKKEVQKLLETRFIYPISDNKWVNPVHVVPKKGGVTVVTNAKGESIAQRVVTGHRLCIDYRKLNKATRKNHFPLPFIDQMLERLANHSFFQIPIHPDDQEKTTFTCPYGTFAYR